MIKVHKTFKIKYFDKPLYLHPNKKKEQKFCFPFFPRISILFLVAKKWKKYKNAAKIVQKMDNGISL